MKRGIAFVLVLAVVLSLCGCGSLAKDGIYYFGNEAFQDKVENNPLNPAQVYANLEYNERMLYGRYALEGGEKAEEAFVKESSYRELTFAQSCLGESMAMQEELSVLPMEINLGPASLGYSGMPERGEHEWAELKFATPNGGIYKVMCSYTVAGNTVTFTPLAEYCRLLDENYANVGIHYVLGTEGITYTFQFSGPRLTLSQGDESVTLCSFYFSDIVDSVSFGGYLAEGSAVLDGIDNLLCTMNKKYSATYIEKTDGAFIYEGTIGVYEDGRVSLYWQETDEAGNVSEHQYHLVYFPGDGYCMTLTDGETFYYYTESHSSREKLMLSQGMSEEEQAALNEMEEDEIKVIAEKKASLLDDLAKAYEEAGMDVKINRMTGEIMMDSAVLFDVNVSDVSESGKEFLKKFIGIYTSVVFSEKYEDFVSRIQVEGHTDTSGSYELNKELSQARAQSVMDYCLSEESGIDGTHRSALTDTLEAVGYAYDKPVYAEDGTVDMEASRRVAFRFIINLGSE